MMKRAVGFYAAAFVAPFLTFFALKPFFCFQILRNRKAGLEEFFSFICLAKNSKNFRRVPHRERAEGGSTGAKDQRGRCPGTHSLSPCSDFPPTVGRKAGRHQQRRSGVNPVVVLVLLALSVGEA